MITVVLPVRDQGELVSVVLAALREEQEPIRTVVFDNGSERPTRAMLDACAAKGEIEIIEAAGMSLYQMWNAGWMLAETDDEVAFLNSDIDFHPGTMHHMAQALRDNPDLGAVCPDYNVRVADGPKVCGPIRVVTGSYRDGGLCGWCFMVRPEIDLRVDEEFEWWAGDDDLFRQIDARGYKLAILGGLAVDHVGEATARHYPDLEHAKGRDMVRLREKWGW